MPRKTLLAAETQTQDDSGAKLFLENLCEGPSNFRDPVTGYKYGMAPAGFYGSIVEVPERVARNPWIARAVKRGKVSLISRDEYEEKLPDLRLEDEVSGSDGLDHIREALSEGAMDRTSRYKVDRLPEEADQGQSLTSDEVWEGKVAQNAPQQRSQTVRRSGTEVLTEEVAPKVLSPEDVLQPTKQSGDVQPDTGI
jgi:hypothetical protein